MDSKKAKERRKKYVKEKKLGHKAVSTQMKKRKMLEEAGKTKPKSKKKKKK